MKRKSFYVAIVLLFFLFLTPKQVVAWQQNEEGCILVISSYNPDTKRMSSFMSEFEKAIADSDIPYNIYIENLECKGVNDAPLWVEAIDKIMIRYAPKKIKAVVLLGQEAWASFLSRGQFPSGVLFFGGFVSSNGVIIPPAKSYSPRRWAPKSVDFIHILDSVGSGGGLFNKYDVCRNIDLIKTLYPEAENIAFVSDNTYGGISLQALVKKNMSHHPELKLILVDSRRGEEKAKKIVASLPEKSVILLGTWRVGSAGQYFTQSALRELLESRPTMPVFSITGTGIGAMAVGGYIPTYNNGAAMVAQQIISVAKGEQVQAAIEIDAGHYQFDSKKLRELKISEYALPKGSEIVDVAAVKLKKYSYYMDLLLGSVVILVALVVFVIIINIRIRALKRELEHREGELIIAKAKAEESDMLKSAFLANMSHEIRTPLNAIVGFSSLMQDEELTKEDRSEYCSIVVSNSEMLLTLLNDILDISRLESGKIKLAYAQTDIVQVCQHAILTTHHTRPPKVPLIFTPPCSSYLLYTDAQRLSQVLINLLTNAGKFTSEGAITLAFELPLQADQIIFSVTDTGTGIPLDKQEVVFNRFEKLGQKKGTGLGLAICRQIILLLGGTIQVDSAYTEGARFVFTLPIRKAPTTTETTVIEQADHSI
ncbi:MAG: ATP-binding protein [Alistipes sp.]